MLELKSFDGVSSRDAPGFKHRDPHEYYWLGLWTFVFDFLGDVWRWLGTAARKRKVRQLQAELLPRFPNSIICPRCLGTIERP